MDAYSDEEQRLGLYTAIEDHLATPFTTECLTVAYVYRTGSGMVALCRARSIGRPSAFWSCLGKRTTHEPPD